MGRSSSAVRSCSVGQSHLIHAFIGTAFSDDERNVVLLFVRTETAHFVDHCRNPSGVTATAVTSLGSVGNGNWLTLANAVVPSGDPVY